MSRSEGTIFQTQRWSIHDGEGIRSTVFLKGCPLRCQWCANPESWQASPEVLVFNERCQRCGRCVQACQAGALTGEAGQAIRFDRDKCRHCFACCEVCPAGARKPVGTVATVAAVMSVIRRDAVFYRESGGGVTFSGGEPFAQPEFLRQLVAACSRQGIATAVETSGCFDWETVKDIMEQLDHVFVDIKHMDDAVHRRLTGVGNQTILANIAAMSRQHPAVIVRVPLMDEVNANASNIRAMCDFLRRETRVIGVELLPYHDFGQAKYRAVGASVVAFSAPDTDQIAKLKQIIAEYGIAVLDFR